MAERSASYSSGKEEEEEGGQEVYREFALPLGVAEGGGFGADKSNILLLPESASNPTCNSHSGNSNSNSNCSGSSISAQSYVNIDVSGELTSQPQTKSSVSNSASLGHVFKSFTAQPTASISSAHAFIMSEQASAASSRITRYLPKLRCKISSDLIDLNRLHDAKYTWIPSEEQVRPTPEVRQKKLERLDSINKNWLDFPDYIYHSVFGKEMVTLSGKLTIFDRNTESEIRFAPNEFPYRVAGNHFVLWFGVKVQEYPDDCITDTIDQKIREIVQSRATATATATSASSSSLPDSSTSSSSSSSSSSPSSSSPSSSGEIDYDFAWYVNPKMTVPEFFHVQVFWIAY